LTSKQRRPGFCREWTSDDSEGVADAEKSVSRSFDVYSTMAGIPDASSAFLHDVLDSIRIAEHHAFSGTLLYQNFASVDPWCLASYILQQTDRLVPLIATQPVSVSPHTLARFIGSIAHLYQRRVYLNMVVGASPSELAAVGDTLGHDERYARAVEYVQIVKELLAGKVVTCEGRYHAIRGLTLAPLPPPELAPLVFFAGSSPAGLRAARECGDVLVTHPEPWATFERTFLKEWHAVPSKVSLGIRVGILARPTKEEAWDVAYRTFPPSRRGEVVTKLKKNSESDWVRKLAHLSDQQLIFDEVFWLGAFRAGGSSAIHLVGTYADVAAALSPYLDAGVRHIILSGPGNLHEFEHVGRVIERLR
jgi:alkanesulfonate monooxygenase